MLRGVSLLLAPDEARRSLAAAERRPLTVRSLLRLRRERTAPRRHRGHLALREGRPPVLRQARLLRPRRGNAPRPPLEGRRDVALLRRTAETDALPFLASTQGGRPRRLGRHHRCQRLFRTANRRRRQRRPPPRGRRPREVPTPRGGARARRRCSSSFVSSQAPRSLRGQVLPEAPRPGLHHQAPRHPAPPQRRRRRHLRRPPRPLRPRRPRVPRSRRRQSNGVHGSWRRRHRRRRGNAKQQHSESSSTTLLDGASRRRHGRR
mmetsp:Transcript_1596/g.5476  ORF Transcript_1596/g.5476 Transcript_1596/m.5476 type:complete len:263 (-) Transcript_1596:84-872(-)